MSLSENSTTHNAPKTLGKTYPRLGLTRLSEIRDEAGTCNESYLPLRRATSFGLVQGDISLNVAVEDVQEN